MNQKLSEYHTGYRAYDKNVVESINYNINSDDFVFDNQFFSQIFNKGFQVAKITCPTKYFDGASSINLKRSLQYVVGILKTSVQYFLHKNKILKSNLFA